MSSSKDTAGIPLPPPMIPFSVFAAGALAHLLLPLSRWPDGPLTAFGWVAFAAGILLAASSVLALSQAGTPVDPGHPVTTLVVVGPYKFVRNPIYTGFCLVYLGAAWILGLWLCLILFPLVPLLLTSIVIRREEAYLARKFGTEYQDYLSKVRRWGIV